MNVAVLCLLIVAQEPAPSSRNAEVPRETVAVLPVSTAPGVAGEDATDLLASVLASQLAELGGWKVISPEELRALLLNETHRQALGGSDDDALREASGALGARLVLTSNVARVGERLAWSAALVDQASGTVERRGQVTGPNIQALAARADELALFLLGRGVEAQDKVAMANRLGFDDPSDATDFQAFRAQHPEMGTQEALTRYIVLNNIESNRLALAEALVFGGAGAAQLFGVASVAVAYVMVLLLPLGPLAWIPCLGACLGYPTSVALMGTGVTLAVLDALNRGFRKVNRKGCCRDDAEITEAWEANGTRRALALAVGALGPFTASAAFGTLVMFGVAFSTINQLPVITGRPVLPAAYTSSPLFSVAQVPIAYAYLCSWPLIPLPCLVTLPVGLLLFVLPERTPVSDVEGA